MRETQRGKRGPNECWFRRGAPCPFATDGKDTIPRELRRIYEACGRKETHRSPADLR